METPPPYIPYERPPSTSNVPGILALIFGIFALLIGWIPICGSLPALCLALAGIPLGIIGLKTARRSPNLGKGLPITGLVLASLGLLLAGAGTLAPVLLFREAGQAVAQQREAELQRRIEATSLPASFADAAVYFVASESHLAGTGFIIHTPDGGDLAITALHPFDGEKPTTFLLDPLDESTNVELAEITWFGIDVQALRLAPGARPSGPTLMYPGPMPIEVGDRIAILTPGGPAYATVSSAPGRILPGTATPDEPLAAAGLSGAPVILEATGTPVGILIGADNPDSATILEFVKLRLAPGDPSAAP